MNKFNYITLGIAIAAVALVLFAFTNAKTPPAQYEFTSFTVVESIIPTSLTWAEYVSRILRPTML
jgi:hypothetical protein